MLVSASRNPALNRLSRGYEWYEQAVHQYGDRLLRVAQRYLPSDEDARDVVQDALLSAFSHIDRFEQRAQPSTWLHRIVVNPALTKLRVRRRRPEELTDDPLGDSCVGAPRTNLVNRSSEPTDVIMERREISALVQGS